jgi:peptidyl-prolyl cis-trans isomerase D
MALIQKIRGMSGLVLILMFTAIFAFIGMLIMQDANPGGGANTSLFGNGTTLAKVAGQSLEINELDRVAELKYKNNSSDLQVRNMLFNTFVENALVTKEAAAAGLGVSKDELLDLEFGQNISPAIMQNQAFANPQTGQVDASQLQQIKKAIQDNTLPMEGKKYWAEIEKEVIKDRLQAKLTNLMTKGVYTPSWLVDESYNELTQPIDMQVVKVPFTNVEDKDVTVTDGDIESYLKENKSRYMSEEETRSLDYVSFDVIPTLEDSNKLRGRLYDLKTKFADSKSVKDDSLYAVTSGGGFADRFIDKAGVGALKDSVGTASVGTVFGPYVEGASFMLTKLIERRNVPDSVRSRQILLKGPDALRMADSLKAIVEANPSAWDSINLKYSTDPVSQAKGGDIGYFAQPGAQGGGLDPAYNDLIFYKAQQGKYYTVASQFGAHIVQVTGIKVGKNEARYKMAFIREAIMPSPETDRAARAKADDLLLSSKSLEDLKKNAAAKNLAIVPASAFRENDTQLGVFGAASAVRSLIRWAYEAKVGDRNKEVISIQQQGEPFVSKYVLAGLKTIQPKGLQTVASVRENLTPIVRNRKKGEILKAKIGTVTDLNALASQYNSKVDTATGVTFNANFVPNLGQEPKVMGVAFSTPVNSISAPIIGESGVCVLKVVNKSTLTNSPVDKAVLRQQASANIKQMARNFLLKTLRKENPVTDNRSKFF